MTTIHLANGDKVPVAGSTAEAVVQLLKDVSAGQFVMIPGAKDSDPFFVNRSQVVAVTE